MVALGLVLKCLLFFALMGFQGQAGPFVLPAFLFSDEYFGCFFEKERI